MLLPIELAPGAENNGLAVMLADLLRQNLEAKPHKQAALAALVSSGRSVAIVADDAEVALTLRFRGGRLTLHDGIVGIPDVTIRGGSETILSLSNLPLTRRLGLPIPERGDEESAKSLKTMVRELRDGRLHLHGMAFHLPTMMRLSQVMSVNG